jgi:hypothetical protein
MGSALNHLLCRACWGRDFPGQQPTRVLGGDARPCCSCSTLTDSGIYVRMDPGMFLCEGRTGIHAEGAPDAA